MRYRILTRESDPNVRLQLPKAVFDTLSQSAKRFGRTLNTEILVRLARTLERDTAKAKTYYNEEQLLEKIFGSVFVK